MSLRAAVIDLVKWPARYRRSKGFGVHSPFAFRFITDVLRERSCGYYAYAPIERKASELRRGSADFERARLICRLAAFFDPREVTMVGHVGPLEEFTLSLSPRGRGGELLYCGDVDPGESGGVAAMLTEKLSAGASVIVGRMKENPGGRQVFESLVGAIGGGMSFTNGDTGIITGLAALPRQHFSLIY